MSAHLSQDGRCHHWISMHVTCMLRTRTSSYAHAHAKQVYTSMHDGKVKTSTMTRAGPCPALPGPRFPERTMGGSTVIHFLTRVCAPLSLTVRGQVAVKNNRHPGSVGRFKRLHCLTVSAHSTFRESATVKPSLTLIQSMCIAIPGARECKLLYDCSVSLS